ncbi:hypothetical protein RUND412_001136 [Rhizina undulata]
MAAPPWRAGGSGSIANGNRNGTFTQVNARRTLGQQRTTVNISQSPPPPPPPPAQKTQFPDKLKQYVARTFEDCPQEDKPEVESELKRIITDAFNAKVVWTVDWDIMPMPQETLAKRRTKESLKREEQKKAKLSSNDQSNYSSGGSRFIKVESPPLDAPQPISRESRYDASTGVSFGVAKRKSISNDDLSSTSKYDDRYDKRARHESSYSPTSSSEKLSRDKDKRSRRFNEDRRPSTPLYSYPTSYGTDAEEMENNEKPLVGRCQVLEKKYFRLTSAPDPNNVRPLHILEQTLELLKKKWRMEQNYSYICDQFKSLRQDLTVQHIKTNFTVLVYEIHARIALEKGDLGEYNQCQTQLYSLYSEGFTTGHEEEFKAYRILYLLHTCNRADMNDLLANLTPADKKDDAIRHALTVRSVLASGNYHKLFRLYLEAPSMGGYLMDSFICRERMAAMCTICKAYRPDIDIRFLTEELGFESDTECVTFLCDNGADNLIQQGGDDKGVPSSIRFQTSKALSIFDQAKKQAFKKVDIKGQL